MYIRTIALPIALKPWLAALVASAGFARLTPLMSGARVIKKTFRRSNGAVAVRDTIIKGVAQISDGIIVRSTNQHRQYHLPGETLATSYAGVLPRHALHIHRRRRNNHHLGHRPKGSQPTLDAALKLGGNGL